MANNIEIKARVRDMAGLRQRAEALSDTPCQVIPQEDTFFFTPQGRLKLRQLAPDHAQLVYYLRPDNHGPSIQNIISSRRRARAVEGHLSCRLWRGGVVRKVRYLYLAGQARIHLDEVEGLGSSWSWKWSYSRAACEEEIARI
jgi:adenylate cyclase class IV